MKALVNKMEQEPFKYLDFNRMIDDVNKEINPRQGLSFHGFIRPEDKNNG